MRHVLVAVVALVLSVLSFAQAHAQAQNWRLVDADQISSNTYLILTVPLADVSELSAVAESIEQRYGVVLAAEWPLASIAVHCLVIDASARSNIDALITEMRGDAQIRTVQRMQEFEVLTEAYQDPFFPMQHALETLNVVKAHGRSTGSGVRIGVVDSGVDGAHPDLEGRLIQAKDFVSIADQRPAEAHGTAIAGLIAANADGAIGMIGVAPKAELVGLRACWQEAGAGGRCSSFSLARAVNFAIIQDIRVLNLSLGGPPDALLEELIQKALTQGMIIVAASGETGPVAFPASVPGVIAAGRGERGAISAPAVDVISTAPGGRYRYVSGSSVAAAHVSGVVALLLARRADLVAGDVTRALTEALRDGRDGPVLDAYKALKMIAE